MADTRTPVTIAPDRDTMILQKLAGLEQALQGLVPLLEKIITHLEAQTKAPQAPIATYEQMYAPIVPGPAEGKRVAEAIRQAPERLPGWWGRLFLQRIAP